MSLISISERMAALADTHKECMALITRLSKGSNPELAAHIHQTLRAAETSYELLEDEVHSTTDGETIAVMKSKVAKIGEDLKITRLQFRKAQLAGKKNSLLGGAADRAAKRNEKVSQNDIAATAAADVTQALKRTHQLMAGELGRSRFAQETLAQSTEALKELGHRYSVFDDVLGRSKELVRDLVQKNKSDRWYYEKAIQILLGTLIWILVRRLFWGPIYLVVGLPMKGVWWVGKGAVGVLSHSGTQGVSEVEVSASWTTTRIETVKEEGYKMTMVEEVGQIIDGGETTVVRNPKSRRFEYYPEEEAAEETGSSVIDTPAAETEVHDEL